MVALVCYCTNMDAISKNFILFQIEILLYNIIMQNTLDQLAVGTCYKSVCYSFARKYMGLVTRC